MAIDLEKFASEECRIDTSSDLYKWKIRVTHLKTGLKEEKEDSRRFPLFRLRKSALITLYNRVQERKEK